MKRLRALIAVVIVGLLSLAGQLPARASGPQYITVDVPNAVCKAPFDGTAIYGIDPQGDVVGFYSVYVGASTTPIDHGFLMQGGTFSTIDPPGSVNTLPTGITPSREIAGAFLDAGGVPHGFLLNRGAYTIFDVPGSTGTVPFGIGVQGDAVGQYFDNAGSGEHGFVRTATGHYITFDIPAGVQGTVATGITPSGIISGFYFDSTGLSHSFLRQPNGSLTTFDQAHAGGGTYANAINFQGSVTGGWIENPNLVVVHGFLRTPAGTMTTFDDPSYKYDPAPNAVNLDQGTSPHAISPQGIIAGKYTDANGCYHGFMRLPG